MITYKIIETSISHFKDIDIPFDFGKFVVGSDINFLGYDMRITQLGGGVVGMVSESNIMILQEQIQKNINIQE